MRVLVYGDFYLSASGFAREIRHLLEALRTRHDVRQVALGCDGSVPNLGNIVCYKTQKAGVSSHWAPEILGGAIDDFSPDVLISVHDYLALPALAGAVRRENRSGPRWVHWGTLDGLPVLPSYLGPLRQVDLHLTQSHFAKEGLLKAFGTLPGCPRIEVAYPGVDLHTFRPLEDRHALRARLGLGDSFTVLMIARNQFRKNTPALLEAVALLKGRIPNLRLVIHSLPTRRVDGRPDGYDLRLLCAELGIEDSVTLMENPAAVTDSVLNELYNAADLHCLPTMGEGFGIPLVESMAAGTPNVATDCSSCTEILASGRGALVAPSASIRVAGAVKFPVLNAKELADAIFRLYENPFERESMRAKSLEWVQGLARERCVERVLNLIGL